MSGVVLELVYSYQQFAGSLSGATAKESATATTAATPSVTAIRRVKLCSIFILFISL